MPKMLEQEPPPWIEILRSREQVPDLRGVDPETCMIVFKNHWVQVLRVLEKHGCHDGLRLGPVPGDETSTVQNYVEHMLFLLVEEESGVGGAMGPILEFVVVENVMEKLFLWSLRREFTDDAKLEQLHMYQMLVGWARQPLLHHKPVLRPLTMLLAACSGPSCAVQPACHPARSAEVEVELVQLLWRMCHVLVRDPTVLELLFHSNQDQGAANFLVFSLLVPFVHRDGPVGAQARDALGLVMALSNRNPDVASHIVKNTYFCPVLATGLSGLYSCLPAKLEMYSKGWYCLQQTDCVQVPALIHFLNSLQFCCTVCKVAHPCIRNKLLGYIYNGFIVPVMAPALHKMTLEEVMTSTVYLELFLRRITDPALLRIFLIFILKHRHDNVLILDTLVSRINTPFQLGTVSLALFRTLIGLYCEDVMLQLILRYLIPCTHLRSSERHRLRERDCHSSNAAALLFLTPSFFSPEACPSPALPPKPDYILWSKVTEELLRGNTGCEDLSSGGNDIPQSMNLVPLLSWNYLQYLSDARSLISTSVQACQVWSAPYDGFNPAPMDYQREEEIEEQEDRGKKTVRYEGGSLLELGDVLPELEWDNSCDAGPHSPGNQQVSETSHIPKRPLPEEPPRHVQEMQKRAIMLFRGSYFEESNFQDDILVYNLIAQKDTLDDPRASLKNTQRSQKHNHSHCDAPSKANNHEHPYTCGNTQNHIYGNVENDNPKPSLECSFELSHGEINQESPKCVKVLNGQTAEQERVQPDSKTAHFNHNQKEATVTSPQHQPGLPTEPSVGDTREGFISQSPQLIRTTGRDDESTAGIEVHFQRLTSLLHGEEEEADFGSHCNDDYGDEEGRNEHPDWNDGDRSKHGVPFTGPFLSVLLSRLENMLENPLEVNLLVTGILAQLASYPQPLLRCFLLGTRPTFHPSVRSLYQVLVSVGCQIEQYAASRPEFTQLVQDAAVNLLCRDQAKMCREQDFLLDYGWFRNGHTPVCLQTFRPPCPEIPLQSRNRAFAAFLYAEFLKELAAVVQEHSVLPDLTVEEEDISLTPKQCIFHMPSVSTKPKNAQP
ncbi:protein FAM160A1 isoform X2 [Electrophorus electricus]|uniref:protein FAM160A1 isoform X2 n=1 Tax=Electrophorus electricus TaxID=8005 RepID=UPI0015D0A2F3|nr:protein FAM160A1 isoform X2 [Electrophorus electricus]